MANGRFGDAEGTGERHDADGAPVRDVAERRGGAAPPGDVVEEGDAATPARDGDDLDGLWRSSARGDEVGRAPAASARDVGDDRVDDPADPDLPWKPSPPPGSPPSTPHGPAAAGPTRQARAERIVLTDESSTSAWARPRDGSSREVPEPPDAATVVPDDPPTPSVVGAPSTRDLPADEAVEIDEIDEIDEVDEIDEGGRPRPRTGRLAVAGVLVAVIVGLTIAATVLLRDREERAARATASAPPLPEGAQIAWTTGLDGAIESAAVGDGLVAVVSSDGLTVLSAADGDVVWRRVNAADAGEIEQVAMIDGHVVATQQGAAGTTEVRSFDPATGTELWRTRGREGTYAISGPADAPIIVGRRRVEQATELSVLDAADGTEVAAPIRLSGVEAVGGDFAASPTERQVAVWSPDELAVVAGPVDQFNLRTVAELDGAVVALDLEGRIVAFDDDGRRSDELVLVGTGQSLDGGSAIASVDFVGVTASGVGVISGESSLGFAVVDDRIETVWERSGFATEPVATSVGELSVLVAADDSGEIGESILDALTGSVVAPIEAPGPRERLSMLAANGYVVAPLVDAADRVVAAVGYDGEPLWSLPLSPEADYEVTADGIVVIEPTPGGADVSFAR